MQLKKTTMQYVSALGGFDDKPLRAFLAGKQVRSLESWHFVHKGKI